MVDRCGWCSLASSTQSSEVCGPGLAVVGAIVLMTASAADLETRLIPNRLVAFGAVATSVVVLAACPSSVFTRTLGALACSAPLLVAAIIRPEGMGMGDVKLAGLIGLMLGPGPGAIAVGIACLAGVMVGITLVPFRGMSAMRATIPFAPFLAAGALIASSAWAWPGWLT